MGCLTSYWQPKKNLENIFFNSKKGTIFFIALYNDQGINSKIWKIIKYTYNFLRFWPIQVIFASLILLIIILRVHVFTFANVSISFKKYKNNPKLIIKNQFKPFKKFLSNIKNYKRYRGMSYWHDQIDWIGGYPYEVSKPNDIINFFKRKNCDLMRIKITKGYGNNIYLFKKN